MAKNYQMKNQPVVNQEDRRMRFNKIALTIFSIIIILSWVISLVATLR